MVEQYSDRNDRRRCCVADLETIGIRASSYERTLGLGLVSVVIS